MKKKSYIQPVSLSLNFTHPIMQAPLVSKQFDDEEHTPIGDDDGDDNFTTKEREEKSPWTEGLW